MSEVAGQTNPIRVPAMTAPHEGHLAILDGWRASSILLVIAGHWLPLNAVLDGANNTAGALGMAIFFTLSGFLITRFLIDRPEPGPFLIRRLFRILPLAWAAMLMLYLANRWAGDPGAGTPQLIGNLAFYANLPPARLLPGGEHFWSLCVEIHFYLAAALLVALGGRRALYALPLAGLAITAARILAGETISIVTWHRADEILAGATLALIHRGLLGERVGQVLAAANFYLVAAAALAVTYALHTPLAYARPYAVALMVGVTLYRAPQWLRTIYLSRAMSYIAQISYALYVYHAMFAHSWLGSGDTLTKYLKRPLLALVTWAAAHVSTFYYEKPFIERARRLTRARRPERQLAS